MNMFKSRRKAKEQSDALEALTGGRSPPTTYKTVKSIKRKNKNTPENATPVFDLSSALPDSDEFRTSLLMPNLSARFSMLREQDDPNSKLGKASDDSVLFPKRASRLNLFGHTALADVAEDDAIYSGFRPPFADRDRANSMGDGYESDNGSVMSRSRPGEGNNLFGGRQKLYRIATNSTRTLADTDGAVSGRYIYEHDVALSQFQQYRRREKEAQTPEEANRSSVPVTDGGDNSEIASPATAFSKNRGTQSSTNSGPRRSSTAATSVASESPAIRNSATDIVTARTTGSTSPSLENQVTLALSKTREEAIPNRFVSVSKSSNDRFQRPGPFSSASMRKTSSPVAPVGQPLDFGFKTDSRSISATGRHQTDSPTPSPLAETDDVLASNLQPNDRGKATALGLFNKPAREFDEHQFSQRQLQMHEGHMSSMSNNSRSDSRASNAAQQAQQSSAPAVTSPSPVPDYRASTPQVPPIPDTAQSPAPSNRASRASGRSTPPRPRSKSSASATATANVKARLESLIRKQNAELAALECEKLGAQDSKTTEDPSENKENYTAGFFDNDDDEDSDLENANSYHSGRANSSKPDESDIHPAFRNSYRVSDGQSRRSNYSNFSRTRSVFDDERRDSSRLQVPTTESESAGQQNGSGLSGLIRTHLRQDSDRSSIMPRPESGVTQTNEPSRTGSVISTCKPAADGLQSEPFDFDINRGQNTPRVSQAPPTPTTAMSQVAQHFLSQAMAMKVAAEKDKAEAMADRSAEPDSLNEKPWHEDLEPKHQRGASSETTKERQEFDEELAERRRKIREGLRSVTERERSQSPANVTRGQITAMQAFVQQRAATDPQPKAMRMLGLQTRNGQSGFSEDDRGRKMSSSSEARGRAPSSGFSNKHTATYARFQPDTDTEQHHTSRSATPPAGRYGTRDRSNSNVIDRSKSRSRNKESNPPLPNGRGQFVNRNMPSPSPTDEPRGNLDQFTMAKHAYRSARSPPPDLMMGFPTRASPRPSPISPQSPHDSPMEGGRPSPGPYASGRTTPSSGRTTPSAFNRKRSVTKTMISEPTFVSSTSSVPLVHLPTVQQSNAPPLPLMNPRRRGNTTGEKPILSPLGPTFSRSTPLEPVPASPIVTDFGAESTIRTKSPSPRKLRKANSEGGSMAAKARQQAVANELAQERTQSPAVPVFPNRSATALGMSADGAMF